METDLPIVYFDGVCGFCNASVNRLVAMDRRSRLRFAPLQGTTAQAKLPENLRTDLSSIVFSSGGVIRLRSAAIVRILWTIGGIWKLVGWMMWVIPLPLRDLGYRIIGRLRYRIAGKQETCRMPTPEQRALFLD